MSQRNSRRDVSLPKGRQVSEAEVEAVRKILGDLPVQRDLLIEALHLLQDHRGCISPTTIAALAEVFSLAQAEVFEVASFYDHFDVLREGDNAPPVHTVRVSTCLSCELAGAEALIDALRAAVNPEEVRVMGCACIGQCDGAPVAWIGKRIYRHASVDMLLSALAQDDTATPVLPAYEDLAAAREKGAYEMLARVRGGGMSADAVIEVMSDAGLRGLGGAGFPVGRKWGFVRSYTGPRLMTVNGDEGEPGTFKDRWLLEHHPHALLEGAQIAAHVVGCSRIYIYLRNEYPTAHEILRREIAALEAAGLAPVPMELRRGAGAYICGEESAMIESIEGKRGLPRHKPPFIAERGLFQRPTLNHNIETLAWVPEILRHGPGWFANQGWSDAHKGLRRFSVSGRVRVPGVKLAPAGIPLDRLIEEHCGGMQEGHQLRAFFPGGASGGIFPAHMADRAMDFGSWEPDGGFIGSHAVVILSQHDSILAAALNTMRFFRHESCGQCTPCRSGTDKLVRLLESRTPSRALYDDLLAVMEDASICGLGQAAGNCVKHLLRYFPEELTGETENGPEKAVPEGALS